MVARKDNIFHDINIPSHISKKENVAEEQKLNTGVTDSTADAADQNHEVKLLTADQWVEGENGFTFNEVCYLKGTGQFLTKTIRKKIVADTFVRTEDNVEEDIRSKAEGFMENDGSFSLKVTLYFGKHYYTILNDNPDAKCWYSLKNIRHSKGANVINSIELEMPSKPLELEQFSL